METRRQRETQTSRCGGAETSGPTDLQTCRFTDPQTHRPTDLQTYRPTDLQTHTPTYLQSHRPTDLQTYRPADMHVLDSAVSRGRGSATRHSCLTPGERVYRSRNRFTILTFHCLYPFKRGMRHPWRVAAPARLIFSHRTIHFLLRAATLIGRRRQSSLGQQDFRSAQ